MRKISKPLFRNFFIFFSILIFAISPLFSLNLCNYKTSYAETQTTDDISIGLYDSNGSPIPNETKSISVGGKQTNVQTAKWKDISYFSIKFNSIDEIDNIDTTDINSKYEYQYKITWLPIELEDFNSFVHDQAVTKPIPITSNPPFSASSNNKADMEKTINWVLDNKSHSTLENKYFSKDTFQGTNYKQFGEWGLYQITFICNNKEFKKSNIISITPTKISDISSDLTIEAKATRSKYLLNNAYDFIVKTEDYKYVKRDQLVWKVSGKDSNGKRRVLLPRDTQNDSNAKAILEDNSEDYKGLEFLFDFDITGEWTVHCEATDENGTKISNSISIQTIRIIPTETILWVVGGFFLLIILILLIVVIVQKRKERIW